MEGERMFRNILIAFAMICFANCRDPQTSRDVLILDKLSVEIDKNGWHFTDDERIIGRTKSYMAANDETGILRATIDDVGLQFFLFKHPVGANVEYNDNVTLLTQDITSFPGIRDLRDLASTNKRQMATIMKEAKFLSEEFKNIGGIDVCIQRFDSEQGVGYKKMRLHHIGMMLLKDRVVYTLTGSGLQENKNDWIPEVERILFSIRIKQ